jgi:hypothetical protein
MNPDLLRPGTVLTYPYLWLREQKEGETEGRKERPVCMVIALKTGSGTTHLMLLAISSKPPIREQDAIEIPEIERRRGGLSEVGTSWIVISEYNYDVAEQSFYLRPDQAPLGRFSRSFVALLAARLAPLLKSRTGRVGRL